MEKFKIGLGVLLFANNQPKRTLNVIKTGMIYTREQEQVSVVLKPSLPVEEMAREFFSACVASILDLPVPSQYLVLDEKTGTVMYACGFLKHPNLCQLFRQDDLLIKDVINKLYSWKSFSKTAAFDELIQNTDRNLGNILWAGDQDYVLIDHGLTFGSRPPDGTSLNKLIQAVLPVILSQEQIDSEVVKYQKIAEKFPPLLGSTSLQDFLEFDVEELSALFWEEASRIAKLLENNQINIKNLLADRSPNPPLFRIQEDLT